MCLYLSINGWIKAELFFDFWLTISKDVTKTINIVSCTSNSDNAVGSGCHVQINHINTTASNSCLFQGYRHNNQNDKLHIFVLLYWLA